MVNAWCLHPIPMSWVHNRHHSLMPEPASLSSKCSLQPLQLIGTGSLDEAYGLPVPWPTFSLCWAPPLLWMVNKGIFHSLSTKKKKKEEEFQRQLVPLCFFSHLSVVQVAVIQCVNVCLLFSFYYMHFDFFLSSFFPSHVAQKIKQGAPNYLLFGLIKFSCSALCWWKCVDDEHWWDFPFFPHLFRKSSPLERSQVTSVLPNLPKLSQSVFGATVDTSGPAHLLNSSSMHFPSSSLMMILWLLSAPFPPLVFSVGASPGLLSWLPLDSTWMTSSSPLVFNLYLNTPCILNSIIAPLWSTDLGAQQPAKGCLLWPPQASTGTCFICLDYSYFHRAN